MTVRPIPNMVNHETNELFFDNLEIPVENLIGEEGKGFKYILDGLNAERTLIAAECIGDGYWFIDKVAAYAKERTVFGRPIGQNQGVQFPIARAYVNVEAANLMRFEACRLFDAHEPCGAQANMASCWPPMPPGKQPTPACNSTAASASPTNTMWNASSARPSVSGGANLHQPDPVLWPNTSWACPLLLTMTNASHPHLSAELAAFAAGLRYEDIPAPVLRRAAGLPGLHPGWRGRCWRSSAMPPPWARSTAPARC